MAQLHYPWLTCLALAPLVGAVWVRLTSDADVGRRRSLIATGVTLLLALGALGDFVSLRTAQAYEAADVVERLTRRRLFFVDDLSAPLLLIAALLYFLTVLATMRTKGRRFSFSWALLAESILLATIGCEPHWGLVVLIVLGAALPLIEFRRRGKPARVFVLHMAVFAGLLLLGQALLSAFAPDSVPGLLGVLLLTLAVLLRSGIAPVHCWMTDLFEHASFGASLLFVTPMIGAFAAMRLVLPVAPAWILSTISIASLLTAVYAAGMSIVQTDARRFFSYQFLSHSSLVLVGLETTTPIALTGALCVWIAASLSMTGLGLTLRSVESRMGRLSLLEYHGLYEHIPALGVLFLLTGLAGIGFPGTLGFVGAELLVESAARASPVVGAAVVMAAALNGIAMLRVFFRIFTGTRHLASVDIRARPRERIAVLVIAALILGGGLHPQPGVSSCYHAAMHLSRLRQLRGLDVGDPLDRDSVSVPLPGGLRPPIARELRR